MAVSTKLKSNLQTAKNSVKQSAEAAEKSKGSGFPDPWTPEGFLLIVLAIMIDILGVVLAIVTIFTAGGGFVLEFIPDILGTATIGVYMWRKTGHMPVGKRLGRYIKRYGLEWIPLVGIVPLWSVFVIVDLTRNSKS